MNKILFKIWLFVFFLIINQFIYCTEKSVNEENINFNFKSISNIDLQLNNNNEVNLYKYSGFSSGSKLYKTGVNLLIFGVVSGVLSGSLVGTGFVFTWILARLMNWQFGATFTGLISSYSLFGSFSLYASLAISCFVVGAIFAALFLMIIPGIVLMSIGSRTLTYKYQPLNDAIGVSLRL